MYGSFVYDSIKQIGYLKLFQIQFCPLAGKFMDEDNFQEERQHQSEIERLAWMISVIDQQIDRFNDVRRVAYQKSAWMFIAATGFVTLSGVTSRQTIRQTFTKFVDRFLRAQEIKIEGQETIIFIATMIIAVLYSLLFYRVWKIYSIRRLAYPFRLLEESATIPTSVEKNKGEREEWVDKRYDNAIRDYINAEHWEVLKTTLWNLLDITTGQMAQNREYEEHLTWAYRFMPFFFVCFVLLLTFSN